MNSQAVLAIVLGGNLILCLCLWYWARPASGAVKAMPLFALLTVAMLLGILPKLVWPAAEGLHMAGSIASMILTTGVIVMQIRRIVILIRNRRSLHRGARPA